MRLRTLTTRELEHISLRLSTLLPEEIREPLLTIIEAHAKAHEQRYWMWLESNS